jgi:DNA-binding transcriptional MerR regulator
MDTLYHIGQLAQAAGVPTSTLRYYERAGLLRPTGRAENNYRLYTTDTLQTVRFIRAAQAVGLTLDDVRALLALRRGDLTLCKDVQPLIAKRLHDISQRIEDLQHLQQTLTALLAVCHQQAQDAACPVIAQLTATAP